MSDPFEILGLTPQASEDEIRARYLELVREYPPDRAPERFASVRSAYDELRDPLRRLDDEVLALSTVDTLDALAADVRRRLAATRLSADAVLSLGDPS